MRTRSQAALALLCALLLSGCSDDEKPPPGDEGPPDMALDSGPDRGGDGAVARNPLDEMDPTVGPVASALKQLSQTLQRATSRHEVATPDRILDLADPLGTARLVRLAEAEAEVPCDPAVATHCAKPQGAQQALGAFAGNKTQLRAVLDAAFQALDGWARLALARYALQLINLFHQAEQAGSLTIPASVRNAWTQAAADLPQITIASGDASVLWTDWDAILPTSAPALLKQNILRHDPAPYPTAAARQKAAVLTGLVAAFASQTWGARDPFYFETLAEMQARCGGGADCKQQPAAPVPAPQSAGAQAVRALAHLRAMAGWTDGQTEIDAYLTALSTLVQSGSGGGPVTPQAWQGYRAAGQALLDQLEQRRMVTARHATVKATAVSLAKTLADSLDDPNATDHAPNAATRSASDYETDMWTNYGPTISLHTADAAAEHDTAEHAPRAPWVPVQTLKLDSVIPGFGLLDPGLLAQTTHLGSSDWPTAGPTKIAWTVAMSVPLDHVDLRIFRTSDLVGVGSNKAVPFRHFLEVPDASGGFPMATWFDPREDSELTAAGPNKATYRTYVIKAVAVDEKGKHSGVACLQLDVRYGTDPAHDCDESGGYFCPAPLEMEPSSIIGCTPEQSDELVDSIDDYLDPDTIEIREVTGSGGESWTYYRPNEVVMHALADSITLINDTSQQHHFKSVHTAPYAVDLVNPVITNRPIGGVTPLDFGVVPAGGSKTLPLPAGSSQHYQWTLYDVLGDLRGYRPFRVWIHLPTP